MRLKLVKIKSYSGAVSANQKKPYVEVKDAKQAQALLDTGYFVEAANQETASDLSSGAESGEQGVGYAELSSMTKAELEAYAAAENISLEGCTTKAEMLEVISVAHGGNYTMIDLQRA